MTGMSHTLQVVIIYSKIMKNKINHVDLILSVVYMTCCMVGGSYPVQYLSEVNMLLQIICVCDIDNVTLC